jgi:GT2 family glycosyltransferase
MVDAGSVSSTVAVVLLNYNGWRDTLACVDSLLQSHSGFRMLVICDNGSPDGSMAELQKGLGERAQVIAKAWERWWPGEVVSPWQAMHASQIDTAMPGQAAITLIDNGHNWGFAKGNNHGLRWARRDPHIGHFWLLNNDTVVPPETLGALHAAALRRPKVGLLGATVVYHHDPARVQALGGGALNRRTAETRHLGALYPVSQVQDTTEFASRIEAELDYVLGASMWATRAWLDKVGLLGEDYFLYYEEMDWAMRGRPFFELAYVPEAVVFHKEGASIGTDPSGGSPFSVFHLYRSKLIFARKHLPGTWLTSIWWASAVRMAKWALKGRLGLSRAALNGLLASKGG